MIISSRDVSIVLLFVVFIGPRSPDDGPNARVEMSREIKSFAVDLAYLMLHSEPTSIKIIFYSFLAGI